MRLAYIYILATILMGGCASGTFEPPPSDLVSPDSGLSPYATTRERLARDPSLELMLGRSLVQVTALAGSEPHSGELKVSGGQLRVGVNPQGTLQLSQLQAVVDDVDLSLGHDDRLDLTNIRVSLGDESALATVWDDAGQVGHGEASVELVLDWALRVDDQNILPLDPQHLAGIEVTLETYTDVDGSIVVEIVGDAAGDFWDLGGLVTLQDLHFELLAIGRGTVPEDVQ